mmetsp:Transcript_15231/g.42629  ORF Transcript_15231/g.42629 Transcript_15231/m.42629 type:complete len:242 (-) Transcript_15231:72-797(-)|eukprot:CAMPEP_0117654398 /NCGR_PEP_ID=MMETSP0804-20121206/3723_1 /TAXON_ID=1074897 /ORGANISM="Tetraselmis astigmatica, Strain CCMP880" /LENGTH=241 /DNA_ID=CAMNT_0005460677 /DNA_START=153 /DNA_END=878 /DNA_ORIENTATION=+
MSAAMHAHTLSTTADGQAREADAACLTIAEIVKGVMTDAGTLLEGAQLPAKVESIREAVKQALQAHSEMDAQAKALRSLARDYTLGEEATDFKALLEAKTQQYMVATSTGIDSSELMKEWDRAVWEVNRQGHAAPGGEDEELMIAGDPQPAVNAKCPISAKPVMEMQEPVEDQKGYVYEKDHIINYIKSFTRKGKLAMCPQAGTQHTLTESQLKPARAVLREQRRQKTARPQPMKDDAIEV